MALPETNISVTLVKNELGSGQTSVGGLCTEPLINKWSRFKPVKFSDDWGIGECGLNVSVGTFNANTFSNQWDYVDRVGGVAPANTGFRLGQFRKYKHLAVDPIGATNYQSSDTHDVAYFYPSPSPQFDDVDAFEVTIAGILAVAATAWTGAWYFGVRMRSVDGSGNKSVFIYAIAPEDLNPASPAILSSGVSFNFSNTRFNSLGSTGVYEYEAFITDTWDSAFSSSNLRLQSELTATQQGYRMLTLPFGTGTFNRIATPPPASASVRYLMYQSVSDAGVTNIQGSIAIGSENVEYYVTCTSSSSVNLAMTLTVYDDNNNAVRTETFFITVSSIDNGTYLRTHRTRVVAAAGYIYSYSVNLA